MYLLLLARGAIDIGDARLLVVIVGHHLFQPWSVVVRSKAARTVILHRGNRRPLAPGVAERLATDIYVGGMARPIHL